MTRTSQNERRTSRTITRLKLESLLVFDGLKIRSQQGKLAISTKYGDMPITFTDSASGVRVEMRIAYGIWSAEETEFIDFVAAINEREGGFQILVDEEGNVELIWSHDFSGEVDCQIIMQGVACVGATLDEIGSELRDSFFIQPHIANNLNGGNRQ
jgi:hypothetical protein